MTVEAGPNIVNNGLVLALDAANTKSYPGTGTTWTDLSGNSNTGTLTNGPTYSSANNGSIVFDGVNDYTQFGDILNLGTNNLTINIWARPTALAVNNYNFIVSKSLAGAQNYRYAFGFFNGLMTQFIQGNGGSDVEPRGSTPVSLNTWSMFTFVVTRNSSVTMYLNGNLETLTGSSTVSQWNGLNFQSSNPFRVGSYTAINNSGVSLPFSGNISNVQVYFRSLTQAEITQNFNALRGRYGI
jgi:hypothetical protein